ncbi:mitochondrial sodium/calcium exchanger protein-like [Chelonus insularis]|uniref:mitochondrial sodium/calcium exchanger protein-like n=1 Tax=Chelonus insularis TaxID=460826 RepID=UPI001588E48D|nr:mitochondrial sodium/calcium exchanger protein-like [Chelonus insularis]
MKLGNLKIVLKQEINTNESIEQCSDVWNYLPRDRCQWIKNTHACEADAYIQYTKLLFCWFSSDHPAVLACGLILFVVWLLYLFLVLGTTADNFFCPSLAVIAQVLRLSENIAGVTILAFGNGSPDVFTSLVSDEGVEELIMFTELVGAGVFVTAIIAGAIATISPFRIIAKTFTRDCFFYIFSVCWIAYITGDDVVHMWESLSLILIYLCFIVAVIATQYWDNREANRKARIPQINDFDMLQSFITSKTAEKQVLKPLLPGAFSLKTKLDLAIAAEMASTRKKLAIIELESIKPRHPLPDLTRPTNLFLEFFYDMNPIDINDWKTSHILVKLVLIIRAPAMLVLQFIIPVVNQTAAKNGWSKLLNCIQLCIIPIVATTLIDLHSIKIGFVPVSLLIIIFCAIVAIYVFVKTSVSHPPKYHNIYAFIGFLGATLVVWVVAREVMAVLGSIGIVSGISSAMLGVTLLAWGNSVGDLISNVAIARRGFARMGYAACFGGPMFNTLMGLGLSWTHSASKHSDYRVRIINSDMIPGCIAFLLCSLTTSVIYLNITGFIARKSYGFLLFSIYFVFITMCILSEIGYIHPLGARYLTNDINQNS